ncbi:MAG: ubiE 4 [Frankiales bacterium]|jgi:SAM-dependent methyltransferase|nr:ubiE 4 [Frankiales bacterium]
MSRVPIDAQWVGSMPELYDSRLGPALFAPYASELARRAAALAPATVLELAAGTGRVTTQLVRALPHAHVLATDLNDGMVAWGGAHVPGATWQQADAQQLDLPGGTVELVVCSFGVMFLPDRLRGYREVARVLAPQGALLLTVWDVVAANAFAQALVDALAVVLPEQTPDFVARIPHGYADPDRLRADLAEAGFQDVAVDRVVLLGRAPSAQVLAEGFCGGTPLRFALEQRGQLDELTARVAAELELRLGPGPVEGELAAYVVTARRAPR